MNYYIDMDGTVLDPSLDKIFNDRYSACTTQEEKDLTIKWYRSLDVHNLELNMELIQRLIALKEEGHTLILWTNRGEENIPMTKKNLGIYWHLFSDHQFFGGQKGSCQLNGIVLDNEPKYLKCGLLGSELIVFPTVRSFQKAA
jgi:hypothetical protein